LFGKQFYCLDVRVPSLFDLLSNINITKRRQFLKTISEFSSKEYSFGGQSLGKGDVTNLISQAVHQAWSSDAEGGDHSSRKEGSFRGNCRMRQLGTSLGQKLLKW
jgi:hypothetical protein